MRETSGNLKNLDKQDELHWGGQVTQLPLECRRLLNLSHKKQKQISETESVSDFAKVQQFTWRS